MPVGEGLQQVPGCAVASRSSRALSLAAPRECSLPASCRHPRSGSGALWQPPSLIAAAHLNPAFAAVLQACLQRRDAGSLLARFQSVPTSEADVPAGNVSASCPKHKESLAAIQKFCMLRLLRTEGMLHTGRNSPSTHNSRQTVQRVVVYQHQKQPHINQSEKKENFIAEAVASYAAHPGLMG